MVPLSDYDPSRFLYIGAAGPLFSNESVLIDILLLLLIVVCFIFSAFFSSTETALSSVNTIRIKNYMDEKVKGARKAVILAENYDKTVTAILIGNNLVNIAATTVAASMFARIAILGSWSSVISTFVMTLIVLIFGEILPKTFSKEVPEKVLLRNSSFMWIITKILTPLTWIFIKLKELISLARKKPKNETTPYVTDAELESIIDVMEGEGVIDEDRADLIQSALSLETKVVYDIMTPRVDIDAIEISTPPQEILASLFESRYSRVPVYKEDKDNMIGILSVKDFMFAIIQAENDYSKIDLNQLLQAPYYVSKNTKVDDLLTEMQALKKHFAIVSDEYGGTAGIVTMEDALEELVGEIYDEYDEIEDDDITVISDNHYKISPDMDVEELFDYLELGNPPERKSSIIGAYVYDLCESLPEAGQEVSIEHLKNVFSGEKALEITYKLTFLIKKVENRRIINLELLVEKIKEENI